MRARFFGVLVMVAAIGLSACSTAPTTKEFGKADQDAIKKLVQDFVAAYNAKDLEKVGTFFSGNAALMPANRSTLRGVELVKTYYDERFKNGATNLQIEPHDVSGHGPLGYFTGVFSLDLVPPGGGVPVRDRGKVLWIVHNYGGQWKFEYQIMSSDLPPAVPAPAVESPAGKKK
jgi:ketosteroid isomerase-like protein